MICWFRRDLRLDDNPAIATAARRGADVVGLYVLDPVLLERASSPARTWYLAGALEALDERLGGRLAVVAGDPVEVVARLARELESDVVVASDHTPYGRRRDAAVIERLSANGRALIASGSPYAVAPGTLTTGSGTSFRVFTPFHRAWLAHGWSAPAPAPAVSWADPADAGVSVGLRPTPAGSVPRGLPAPGEAAATAALDAFLDDGVERYATDRNLPGVAGTSRLSAALRFGCLHPRTILARLDDSPGAATFRSELCWREFYADVLASQPGSAWTSMNERAGAIATDEGPEATVRFEAWRDGRTGYPIVDAGMRQLAGEGWMHNRVRMIVASFLVKDLHLAWQRGAAHFMAHLVDGDLASNSHGWQWTAGTGTDAAPFFRVFNPVAQGERFDPDGAYVRRWVPELAHVASRFVHAPWTDPAGPPPGYPAPIVDHATERAEALARYEATRDR